VTSLTWLLPDPRISYLWKSPLIVAPESRLHQIPELRRFLIPELSMFLIPEFRRFQQPRNKQQIRAQEPDSAIIFAYYLKPWKNTWDLSGFLHERFPFTKLNFSSRRWFTSLSHEFRQIRRFEGVRFLPNSPTTTYNLKRSKYSYLNPQLLHQKVHT
jgi:hypothetical protein